MKKSRKLLSLLLAVLMLMSVLCVGTVTANAAGNTVYFKNTAGWSTVYCYMWNKAQNGGDMTWHGQPMTLVKDNIYSFEVPRDDYDMVIFNDNGSSQTGNLEYPGNNYIYDYSANKWSVYDTSTVAPVITSSKKNGASFKTDTMDVTITASYADTASYSIDGGASVSFSDSAVVTVGAGVAVGSTTTLTVTATNSNGTTTESYTYLKKDPSGPVDDGSTSQSLGGYYGTNPDNKVGARKTITVDGNKSDWDESMLVAQGVANDDPRVYCHWSMHERPIDDYALYAAWDDKNLYLMYEMANVQDIVAPQDDFPLSQGNIWIDNLPVFLYIYTGEGNITYGKTANGTLWDSGITFDSYADHIVAFSTNASNGPFIYTADDAGNLDPNSLVNTNTGMSIKWGNGKTLSGKLYGVNKAGTDNKRVAGDTLDESSDWVDFYSLGHRADLDMFYEVSIPLSSLDITASDIETNGIGLMKVSTYGTSGMDCLPYDMSMCDNASKEYSKDSSSSHEKEDEDHITVPFARIGKMFSGGDNPRPTSTSPVPSTTAPSTTAPITTDPPATTAPVTTDPPSTTAPVTTDPPATTAPVTTDPPSTTSPVNTDPPATTNPTDNTTPTSSETMDTTPQPTNPPTSAPAKTTITLKKSSDKVYVKGTKTIKVTVKNGKGKTTYKSSNTKIAKVDSKGKVKGIKKGKAAITIKNNGVSKKFKITVKNPTLNKTSKKLKVNQKFKLKITGKVGKQVYTSKNKNIASVNSNGKIVARKRGKTTIIVKTNGLKLKCKITVI